MHYILPENTNTTDILYNVKRLYAIVMCDQRFDFPERFIAKIRERKSSILNSVDITYQWNSNPMFIDQLVPGDYSPPADLVKFIADEVSDMNKIVSECFQETLLDPVTLTYLDTVDPVTVKQLKSMSKNEQEYLFYNIYKIAHFGVIKKRNNPSGKQIFLRIIFTF